LRVGQLSVDSLRHHDLVVNIGVAIHTSRRVGSLKRRMAQFTTRFEFGVRSEIGET
jgi:hypothetical protein